jgi:hypothetical protein
MNKRKAGSEKLVEPMTSPGTTFKSRTRQRDALQVAMFER